MKIRFTNVLGAMPEFEPKPASSLIPNWYRQTESYTKNIKQPNGNGSSTGTIKRCMPVFDAMTTGYIITSYVDVWVSQKEQQNDDGMNVIAPFYEWPSYKPIEFHPVIQAPLHPQNQNTPFPKWNNPWGIKTPPGYSVLFVPPMHREGLFTILPGVVDTDTYFAPVNFPFVLNDSKFEGLIPAGTPIAQVIPFKRESWRIELGNEEDRADISKTLTRLRVKIFDSYKTLFRSSKDYK